MSSRRERYERANMRGGLGVRKRLSEESLRDSYRLNGVKTGFAVARCYDKYGRWEHGYTVGVIVRKTSSIVQIRWAGTPDEIHTYDQGDARYEVDRGRWRILGAVQGNPLDPDNPLTSALTKLRGIGNNAEASAIADDPTPPTEETEVNKEISHAATERAAAKKALKEGSLQERETYTAKQIAMRCGTDAKTMRKFFRSNNSTVEPVGQGGRYEFDAKDLPKIKREFDAWQNKSKARQNGHPTPKPEPKVPLPPADQVAFGDQVEDQKEYQDSLRQDDEELIQGVKDIFGEDHEPTAEELEEMARILEYQDLDDLDEH